MTELLTDPENRKTVEELKQALDSLILAGQIMEAYETFYAGNVDSREHERAGPRQRGEPGAAAAVLRTGVRVSEPASDYHDQHGRANSLRQTVGRGLLR